MELRKKIPELWIEKARSGVQVVLRGGAVILLLGLVLGLVTYWHFSKGLPKFSSVSDYQPLLATRIFAPKSEAAPQDLELVGEFFKERRYWLKPGEIPERVIRAFVAAEDEGFFTHLGFSLFGTLRAAWVNLRAGHVVQGGSTISQQLAKSLLQDQRRTFSRKIKELILTFRIEANLTKEEIIFVYLNQIYLGSGAYGVEAAAQTYFRKSAANLSWAEAALLAGLPQAPSKYSPLENPRKSKERQRYVLGRLAAGGALTLAEKEAALSEELRIYFERKPNLEFAPHWIEQIRRSLVQEYGEEALYRRGWNVYLGRSGNFSRDAQWSVYWGLLQLIQKNDYRGPLKNLAIDAEIEKFQRDEQERIDRERLGFQVLRADGSMSWVEEKSANGPADPGAAHAAEGPGILSPRKRYLAVVESTSDVEGLRLAVGRTRVVLPDEATHWARPLLKRAKASKGKPQRTPISQIFRRGDVLGLSFVERRVATPGKRGATEWEREWLLEPQSDLQAALVSLDVRTGEILALEGGVNFERSEYNRATQSQRQTGSVFKPFVFAHALEKGYTPSSIVLDAPIVEEDARGGDWKPGNSDDQFEGETTLRHALIHSRNVPTIKIAQSLGLAEILGFLNRIGLQGRLPADVSLALGSGGISLLEVTRNYALFPRMGRKVDPIFYRKIVDSAGNVVREIEPAAMPPQVTIPPVVQLGGVGQRQRKKKFFPDYPPPGDPDQVLDPRVAFVMTHLMKEVINYGTAVEARDLAHPAAGKTGTTSDYKDAWFLGFTPEIVTGVWVGYDEPISMGREGTGARAALPIWLEYMTHAIERYPKTDFVEPPGIAWVEVDPETGAAVPRKSRDSITEAFIEGTEPGRVGGPRAKKRVREFSDFNRHEEF